jgi:hypothetical protein
LIWWRDGSDDCSTCLGWGLAASGSCPNCGRNASLSCLVLPPWADRRLDAWLRQRQHYEIALALASVPLILPLPAVSLAMAVIARRRKLCRGHMQRWNLVLLVAMCNMVLSAWMLSGLSAELVTLVFDWWANMRDLVPHTAPHSEFSPAIPV